MVLKISQALQTLTMSTDFEIKLNECFKMQRFDF